MRKARDLLWMVHEVHLHDPVSKQERLVRTPITADLQKMINLLGLEIPH
jgi:hypothetical protein